LDTLRLSCAENFNEEQNESERLSTVLIAVNEDSSHFIIDVNFCTGKLGISLKHTIFLYYTMGCAY
jgi:hypothetical protein